ncbi:TetR/AcrR family transcriptional regulator [Thermodesulfobacteriota bacterium]
MVDNYTKILKATTKLMSERGYHGTSIQMIADEVGITKSTIIHHFKNKEGILLAILEEFVPTATREMTGIVKDKNINGIDKLKNFLQFHMDQVQQHRDVLNLYIRESRYFGEFQRKVYEDNQRAYSNLAEDIIDQIQKENEDIFKGLIAKVVANAILGMVNYAVIWYRDNGKLNTGQMADHFFQIIMGNFNNPDPS